MRNETLLKAIIEHPDEDTPRLAYADRLDENAGSGAAGHYLLARTVAAFGRRAAKHRAPVPVFFSCMYAVFRVSEPTNT